MKANSGHAEVLKSTSAIKENQWKKCQTEEEGKRRRRRAVNVLYVF